MFVFVQIVDGYRTREIESLSWKLGDVMKIRRWIDQFVGLDFEEMAKEVEDYWL